MESKFEKKYYSIGEVAEMLNLSQSKIRFWENKFSKFIKPRRGRKGDRKFTKEDIETLKKIKHLTEVEGLTLEGVSNVLKFKLNDRTEATLKAIDILEGVKEKLENIRKNLD